MNRPIRVAVADDSPSICNLLCSYFQETPDFELVGTAMDGVQAVDLVKEKGPDAITLDLQMPGLNGFQALQRIMFECPTPVVLLSGVSREAASETIRALNAGAVDFILKYTPGTDTDPEALRLEILAKVRAASKIRVVRSLRLEGYPEIGEASPGSELKFEGMEKPDSRQHQGATDAENAKLLPQGVVVIGASTGGPLALRELLSQLPDDFPIGVIVVQHIPAHFTEVLARQLNRQVAFTVKEAERDDRVRAGLVLIAPGDHHLLLGPDSRVRLHQGPEIDGHRPSVDVTMQSVAHVYGARAKGVVLTGMGADGSQGLLAIHSRGGTTFAQDTASCVVDGMPSKAIEMGIVDHVASPDQIAQLLQVGQLRN